MPNPILHKRSSTAGVVPHAALLANGEIALNSADGTWFIKKTDGTVLDLRQPLVTDGGALIVEPASTDPDARQYIEAVEAADQQPLEPAVRAAITDFVVGCKTDGVWDAIKVCCLLAGPRTLAGALVPLRGTVVLNSSPGSPTSEPGLPGFLPADYDRRTGLLGAFLKRLQLPFAINDTLQFNFHTSTYLSSIADGTLFSSGPNPTWQAVVNAGQLLLRGWWTANAILADATAYAGFLGMSRDASDAFTLRTNQTSQTVNQPTSPPGASNYFYMVGSPGFQSSAARHAFFSIGDAVPLTALDSRVSAYVAAINTALYPQVSNPDAQDWVNRVYTAGGTVSTTTATAVNTFCHTIDAAGLRDRFYRLNLFCGDNLAACLVPLYRGPEPGNGQNLLRSGQEFNLPVWQKEGSVVLSDVGVAPNATVTADLLREDATNNSHRVSQSVTAAANATVTTSIYVKQAGGTRNINLRLQAGADNINATFNLTTGQVTPASGGTGSVTNTTMTLVSGWWRLVLTGIPSPTVANPSLSIYLHNGSTTFYTGDGVSGVHIWGAQTELSAVATAYSGTIYGNTTDTNINFLAADYAETGVNGGLLGNGSSKYLQTGLTTAALPSLATGHLAAYTINATGELVTSFNTGFDGFNFYGLASSAVFSSRFSWGSIASQAPRVTNDLRRGFISMTRTDSTTSKAYKNGLQVGETFSTGSITLPNSGGGFSVFGAMADTGNVLAHVSGRLGAYSIGSGMTDAQMVTYNNAMQAFQTALNRPLAVSNVDAQDWVARVYEAGGTVSQSTADAVNTFCNSINSTGLRDRFYRLNLFCGNDLTACRVPLYRGQSLSGTQFGNTTDTNFNFVASDYVERGTTGGLTGNGNLGVQAGSAQKHLRTGLQQATLATSLLHLSAYVFDLNTTLPQQQSFIGIRNNSSPVSRWWFSYRQSGIAAEVGGSVFTSITTPTGNALLVASRSSDSLLRHYVNGLQSGSDFTQNTTSSLVNRTNDWYVSAANIDGAPVEFCGFRLGMYSIGLTLTAQQAQVFNIIAQNFQAALNRGA